MTTQTELMLEEERYKRSGGPAFPNSSVSMRDYFAAHALAGRLANPNRGIGNDAEYAYSKADEMMKERGK